VSASRRVCSLLGDIYLKDTEGDGIRDRSKEDNYEDKRWMGQG
jgi:hypothetical protein